MFKRPLLVVLMVGAFVGAEGSSAVLSNPLLIPPLKRLHGQPDRRSFDAKSIMNILYQGRPDSALDLVRTLEADLPKDPLLLLIKARVLRETLPDQDDNKKLIRESAEPIHATLDRVISLCDGELASQAVDPLLRFYRGWAWMFKAQLDALSARFWSAGRAAKKGKRDLEVYLRTHPDDPDTKGILGTFLYFADTLPTLIKIIKSIFLIPGGDKEKGLSFLQYASTHEGLLTVDHKIILSAIYTIFEGRFEGGIKGFSELLSRYPSYIRLVEPLGVVAPFYPYGIREMREIEDYFLSRRPQALTGELDLDTIHRIRYHHSFSNMFFNAPELAIRNFRAIIEENPRRPDWIVPLSLINLGCLYARTGEVEKSKEAFQAVLSDAAMEPFHGTARKMLDSVEKAQGGSKQAYTRVVHAVYNLGTKEARSTLEHYRNLCGETVQYDFYLGEAKLLGGDTKGAAQAYQEALKKKVPEVSQVLQMLAAIRLAEIMGLEKNYRAAERYLGMALKFYHKEFLLDMLIKGRKRFYSDLASKALEAPPSLLLAWPEGLIRPASSD